MQEFYGKDLANYKIERAQEEQLRKQQKYGMQVITMIFTLQARQKLRIRYRQRMT